MVYSVGMNKTTAYEYDPMVENQLKALYFKTKELAETHPETHISLIEKQLSILLDSYQTNRG
jgi:hypothetical protein